MADSNKTAFCPECHGDIPLPDEPEMFTRFNCPECGTALEIVNDSPWEVDYDPTAQEDEDEEMMFLDEYDEEEDEDERFANSDDEN
jgi:hypothetical protein